MIAWRYLPNGKVKHALRISSINAVGHSTTALCGVCSWIADEWRGTGTQDEYEKVERMPECKRCVQLLRRKK